MRSLALPTALLAVLSVAGCLGPSFQALVVPTGSNVVLSPVSPQRNLASTDPGSARVLVKLRDDALLAWVLKVSGGTLLRDIPELGLHVIQVNLADLDGAVNALNNVDGVEYAEADDPTEPAGLTPNDLGPAQQALLDVHAPDAWDNARGDGVAIAILDSGLDPAHEDFAGKVVQKANFTLTSLTIDDLNGHGTHVAGIAAAATNNGLGAAGAGYNATLMIGKVLEDNGSGTNAALIDGIVWAAHRGAKVINISACLKRQSKAVEDACEFAWNKNVVLVAAAGNKGAGFKVYPAAYEHVIGVAAVDRTGDIAKFSGHGKWVDVAAPGEAIWGPMPTHPNTLGVQQYGALSGTSYAAPLVSGEAALLWSKLGPEATAAEVVQRIKATCTPGEKGLKNKIGYGLVDFGAALAP